MSTIQTRNQINISQQFVCEKAFTYASGPILRFCTESVIYRYNPTESRL